LGTFKSTDISLNVPISEYKFKKKRMGHNRVANKPTVRGHTDTYGMSIPDPQHCISVTILMSKPNVSNSLHCKGGGNSDVGTRVENVFTNLGEFLVFCTAEIPQ
jgi:hypothetical protein